MRVFTIFVLGLIFCLSSTSCKKEDKADLLEISGTILKIDAITTYQYGEYSISGYAIRSDKYNLDDYINKNVTILGTKIEGYPVENGPEYLAVEEIK